MNSAASLSQKSYWVVVADESRAIVYTRETKRSPLCESFQLENPVARQKTSSQLSDRGGRSFDSHGQGRHTMTREKTDPKKQAAVTFAREIAGKIANAKHDGSCRDYSLVAAPRFLGILRDALETAGHADALQTIDKDMVGQDTTTIEELLKES